MSPRKPGISGVGSSAVLVVVDWGKVSPATDLAVKISRRHRCFPVEQVLREAERETGEKVAENICLLQSWVRRTRTKRFSFPWRQVKKVGCVSAGVEEGLLLSERGSWLREEGEHLVLGLPAVRGGGESEAWKG